MFVPLSHGEIDRMFIVRKEHIVRGPHPLVQIIRLPFRLATPLPPAISSFHSHHSNGCRRSKMKSASIAKTICRLGK